MTCFHPITAYKQTHARLDISAKDYYELKKVSFEPVKNRQPIQIPCGHCIGCKLDHASMWATRLIMEAKNWDNCCFITLTYNNPHLPTKTGKMTLKKKDVQDFFKRLRYYEKGKQEWARPDTGEIERPIRYFGCGEYGPKGGRPHYHFAIFNWRPDDLKFYKLNKHGDSSYTSNKLQKIWGNGFVVVEDLTFNSAAYVARYTLKKAGLEPEKREYTGEYHAIQKIDERNGSPFIHFVNTIKKKITEKAPEFIIMSRAVGIGRQYWEENKEKIKRNKGILLKIKETAKLKPIPKYFKKLWEQENWEEYYRFKYDQEKISEKKKIEIISRISLPDGSSNELKWDYYLKITEKALKQKLSANKRLDI